MKAALIAAAAALLMTIGTASAVTYTVDDDLCSLNLGNSGDDTELDAIADCIDGPGGVTGSDLIVGGKLEYDDGDIIVQTDGVGSYFVDVSPDTPGWFLLKFGANTGSGFTDYVFANIGELTKLVWTSAQIGFSLEDSCFSQGECKLSHITYTGDTSPIPLPAAGLLLVGALGGLGLVRRRRKA